MHIHFIVNSCCLPSSFHPLDKAELSGRAIFIPDQPASGEGDSSAFSELDSAIPRLKVDPIAEEDETDAAVDVKNLGAAGPKPGRFRELCVCQTDRHR